MAQLTVDLQDGFSGDAIKIKVDGQEIYNKQDVNTDYAIGRADSVETQCSEGRVTVAVQIDTKRLSETIALDIQTTLFLGVSIIDDRIAFRTSDEIFPYF